ncbi:MAG: hypothetical protein CSA97_03635, partial [Bacteroidetes bacterium]
MLPIWGGILLLGLLLGYVLRGNAAYDGSKYFSDEVEKFPREYGALLRASGKLQRDLEKQQKQFRELWKVSTLSPEDRQRLMALSKDMVRAAHENRRYFAVWQRMMMEMMGEGGKPEYFDTFLSIMEQVVQNRRIFPAEQLHLLQNTYGLFKEGLLNQAPTFAWSIMAGEGKPRVEFKPTLHYEFEGVGLKCKGRTDSIMLHETSGSYDPYKQLWQGQGGEVHWERSGFSPENVRVRLSDYHIDMKKDRYKADSVMFTNKDFLDQEIAGNFEELLTSDSDSLNVRYPFFKSYRHDLSFTNMVEGVKFKGGCEMRGSWLVGLGSVDNPALFELSRDGKLMLRVQTERMAFSQRNVVSDFAQITVYKGQDSLYHSGLRFLYDDDKKEVRLNPTKLMITRSPMYSSYHKMTIYFDGITWPLEQQKIIFGPRLGANSAQAKFLSDNYFDPQEFDQMMAYGMRHPIYELLDYAYQMRSSTFLISDYARFLGYPRQKVKRELMNLAVQGIIIYNVSEQTITLQPKLYNMVNASRKKIDYDALRFSSSVGKDRANAVLDLESMDLSVYSVSTVNVSDSQNVSIRPRGRFLKMGKNRNMEFDGAVEAGQFTFVGEGIEFNYEDYTIDLDTIETAEMTVEEDSVDFTGRPYRSKVTSKLHKLSGRMKIDEPTNKSGLKRNEDYPIFNCTETSYVYYDGEENNGGVYDRERFNFAVEPFTIKNMNHLAKRDLHFVGQLKTGGVFPDLNDTLRVQPDMSLGFIHPAPEGGLPLYGGKGRFYSDLNLSNSGLKGAGKLTYLSSTTTSPEFTFFPDSTRAISTKFDIEESVHDSVSVPEVHGTRHSITWKPNEDVFYALKGEEDFKMYRGKGQFSGDYMLSPKGLDGRGTMSMDKGSMTSRDFTFEVTKWKADTLSAKFTGDNKDLYAFTSDQLSGEYDYNTETGSFSSIGASIAGNLEALQYEAHADHIDWMKRQNLLRFTTSTQQQAVLDGKFSVRDMKDREEVPPGSVFYSIKPGEDSIYFMSPTASYDLNTSRLNADAVKYILVADARVFPPRGQVTVTPIDRIHNFSNAKFEANTEKRWHKFYNAIFFPYSRFKYGATGRIDYVDARGRRQPIKLDTIYATKPDSGNYTVARGYVAPHQKFRLSPEFSFEGKVNISARDSLYEFNGGARPIYRCKGMTAERLRFRTHIDADSIMIPLPFPPKDINDAWLISGTVLSYDSMHVYPSFISNRFSHDDGAFSRPSGFLTYDKKKGRFIAADSAFFTDPSTIGNRIELVKKGCRIHTSGLLHMPFDLPRVDIHTTGKIIHDLRDESQSMNMFLDLDFHFSKKALKRMAERLVNEPELVILDQTQLLYLDGLKERLDTAQFNAILSKIELFGQYKDPIEDFEPTISFANLRMKWDQAKRSMVSVGRLGIGSIVGIPVQRKVNGFLEFYRDYTGDRFTLYIQLNPNEFFIFTDYGSNMVVNSSDPEFMEIIRSTKRSRRKAKRKRGQRKFMYAAGTTTDMAKAVRRYRILQGEKVEEVEEVRRFALRPIPDSTDSAGVSDSARMALMIDSMAVRTGDTAT